MQTFDNQARYGSVTISLHWITALAMIALMVTGYSLMVMSRGPDKATMIAWHDAVGCLSLAFAFLHVAWRGANRFPSLTPAPAWENVVARSVHWALLFFLIVLPLSGWFAASTGRRPIMIFDWFAFPKLPGATGEYHRLSEEVHGLLSHGFLVVFAAHVLGGLKRQFIGRDGTIARMLGI